MEQQAAHRLEIIHPAPEESLADFLDRAARGYDWPAASRPDDLVILGNMVSLLDAPSAARLASHLLRALHFAADPSMALRNFARYLEALGPRREAVLRELPHLTEHLHFLYSLFSFSAFLSEAVIASPSTLESLLRSPGLHRERRPDEIAELIAEELAGLESEVDRRAALTRVKKRELLRIGIRELRELGTVTQLCHELSNLAQAILAVAVADCRRAMEIRHGRPIAETTGEPAQFAVYAMGKFGAGELNFSSDIDLIMFYDEEGQTEGVESGLGTARARRVSNHEFFCTLTRRIAAYLNDRNPEGFLFRVDLRLRPEGDDGPLARSRSAAVAYLLGHAMLWEKIAYLKARFVAGDEALARLLDPIIEQFVYTDNRPGELLPEIARLKRRIDFERLDEETRQLDIKRGIGGIREIEFIVSALQLLHNTAHPALRTRPTLEALDLLGRFGLLSPDDVAVLARAYNLFRRIEHTLQMMNEAQTHRMPEGREERRQLALRCGFLNALDFEQRLADHRAAVRALFDRIFGNEDAGPAGLSLADLLFGEAAPNDSHRAQLAAAGLDESQGLAALRRLARGSAEFSPSARGRRDFEKLLPNLLAELAHVALPRDAVHQFELLLRAARGYTWVYELCLSHPPILRMILRTLGYGSLLGRMLAAHPEWLDEVFHSGGLSDGRLGESIAEFARHFDPTAGDEALRRLRRFKELEGFLICVQEVLAIVPSAEAASRMTRLAEMVMDHALRIATASVLAPTGARELPVRYVILGLGGLGDGQVHLHGDLDIAFVIEDDADWHGASLLMWADRIARRLIAEVSALTPDGQLWKIDARLRPDGASGPLTATRERLMDYYHGEAGLWEWQAITKARPVAGDRSLGEEILAELTALWPERRPASGLAQHVCSMRDRIIDNIKLPRTALVDIKRSPGGLVDIEFISQYAQLLTGELDRTTAEAVAGLPKLGLTTREEAAFLAEHLALLRTVQRGHRLLWETTQDFLPEDAAKRAALRRALADQLGPRLNDVEHIPANMQRMAELFRRIMAG
jgi:glutamate-ammonia-ligase adenylyltransferase